MGRTGGSDGIVTTLGSEWGTLQGIEGAGPSRGVTLEEGECRVWVSHGSPAAS